jgi:hypothetical protein
MFFFCRKKFVSVIYGKNIKSKGLVTKKIFPNYQHVLFCSMLVEIIFTITNFDTLPIAKKWPICHEIIVTR